MKTLALSLTLVAATFATLDSRLEPASSENAMELGAFSISLSVADLAASRTFYEKLGFEVAGGDPASHWQIMRNGDTVIGLFQGLFEGNILTFNPGWSQQAEALDEFVDVRELQAALLEKGVELQAQADPESVGPASFVLSDPDGNAILVDQHVPRPER